MKQSRFNRREFARRATGTAALMLSTEAVASQKPASANDRIRMGFIGVGEMGSADLADMIRTGQVDVVAIADLYQPHLDRALEKTDGKAKGFKDFRHVLDNKDIDAVCIATPDHWHAIRMIMACEAGKDVYIEKPVLHTLHESRRMVETARKRQRVVQVGTQQRSGPHFQKAVELVRSQRDEDRHLDQLGPPRRLAWQSTRHGCSRVAGLGSLARSSAHACVQPEPLHRELPMVLGLRKRDVDRLGRLSARHRALGNGSGTPRTATFAGGKYVTDNNTETPDTFEVLYEYPASPVSGKEFIVTFSSRFTNSHEDGVHGHGIEFFGTEGTLLVDRSGFTLWPELNRLDEVPAAPVIHSEPSAQHYPHVLNLLECVRSRQKTHSDIETMHRSTVAPLLGVIAQKVGRKLTWDGEKERFVGDEEANRYLTKEYRKPWNVA